MTTAKVVGKTDFSLTDNPIFAYSRIYIYIYIYIYIFDNEDKQNASMEVFKIYVFKISMKWITGLWKKWLYGVDTFTCYRRI